MFYHFCTVHAPKRNRSISLRKWICCLVREDCWKLVHRSVGSFHVIICGWMAEYESCLQSKNMISFKETQIPKHTLEQLSRNSHKNVQNNTWNVCFDFSTALAYIDPILQDHPEGEYTQTCGSGERKLKEWIEKRETLSIAAMPWIFPVFVFLLETRQNKDLIEQKKSWWKKLLIHNQVKTLMVTIEDPVESVFSMRKIGHSQRHYVSCLYMEIWWQNRSSFWWNLRNHLVDDFADLQHRQE